VAIPQELGAAIARVNTTHKVNWSAVACEAFRKAIEEIDGDQPKGESHV
jgi:hypothetical protein